MRTFLLPRLLDDYGVESNWIACLYSRSNGVVAILIFIFNINSIVENNLILRSFNTHKRCGVFLSQQFSIRGRSKDFYSPRFFTGHHGRKPNGRVCIFIFHRAPWEKTNILVDTLQNLYSGQASEEEHSLRKHAAQMLKLSVAQRIASPRCASMIGHPIISSIIPIALSVTLYHPQL